MKNLAVIESVRLGEWAAAWDELVNHAVVLTPFLRAWWLEGVGSGTALFLLVVDEGRLIGGLALERRRGFGGVSVYRLLGSGKLCPDYLDMVVDPERREEVAQALLGWWNNVGAAFLEFDGLVDDHRLGQAFPQSSARHAGFTSYEQLVGTYEDYLQGRSQKTRARLRRAARRFDEAGVTCRRVEGPEVLDVLPVFWALHATRDDRAELMLQRPRIDRAVTLGIQSGEVAACVAEYDGNVLAAQLEFDVAGRVCVYQQARLTTPEYAHLGTRLSAFAIEDACRRGAQTFDLLRGAESYKASIMSHRHGLVSLRAAQGMRGHLLLGIVGLGERVREEVRALGHWAEERSGRFRRRKGARNWIKRRTLSH